MSAPFPRLLLALEGVARSSNQLWLPGPFWGLRVHFHPSQRAVTCHRVRGGCVFGPFDLRPFGGVGGENKRKRPASLLLDESPLKITLRINSLKVVAKEKDESDAISALANKIEEAKVEDEEGEDNDEFSTEEEDVEEEESSDDE